MMGDGMKKTRIAVLVSGGGTNLQALIDAERRGELGAGEISLVLASKPGVYALERAANAGIKSMVLARKAKELGYDAIHDTVHEMAKDEARHGRAFEGLLKRYFK